MSTVRKFTFDLDFDAPEEPETPEPEVEEEEEEEIVPTFSEEEVEEARQKGFDAGKEEGRREAADATEQKLLETIEQACTQLADVYNTQTEANREIGREMISVATAIAISCSRNTLPASRARIAAWNWSGPEFLVRYPAVPAERALETNTACSFIEKIRMRA